MDTIMQWFYLIIVALALIGLNAVLTYFKK
jgi:hypothetical protein